VKLGKPATLTETQWSEAVVHFEHRCAYCGREWSIVEHAVPLEHDGAGTTASNCVPVCYQCSNKKRDLTLSEWVERGEAPDKAKAALDWLAKRS
jgi:5-methylcytosine-specific restriction endonuclease McrA